MSLKERLSRAAVRLARREHDASSVCAICGRPPGEPAPTRTMVPVVNAEMRASAAIVAEYLLDLSPTFFESLTTNELKALVACSTVEQAIRSDAWSRADHALSSQDTASAWASQGPTPPPEMNP